MRSSLLPRIASALCIPAALVCVVGLGCVALVYGRCNRG